ncbi:MAG: EAL domain-containing protein [Trueperaceae bacterium]|nr:EAL domain-containing protein [Trueperaceae bacterium]
MLAANHSLSFDRQLLKLSNDLLFETLSPAVCQRLLEALVNLFPEVQSSSFLLKESGNFQFVASLGLELKYLRKLKVNEHDLLRISQLKLTTAYEANANAVRSAPLVKERNSILTKVHSEPLASETLIVSIGPEVIALIFVDNFENADAFQGEFQTRAALFCEQVSVLMRQMKLQDHFEHQRRELKLLDRVRSAIATELDFNRLMPLAVHAIADVFEKTYVSFYRLQGRELRFVCDAGMNRLSPPQVSATEGIMGRVVRLRTPALVMDVSKDPDYHANYADIISEIVVPLIDREKVIGVLSLESSNQVFNETDFELILAIRKQLNIAIGRTYLYEKSVQSERRFRLLAEYSSDLISLHEADGRFLYVSPSSLSNVGYKANELLGTYLGDYLHPDDHASVETFYQALAKKAMPPQVYRFRHKDGHYVWLEASVQAVKQQDGSFGHYVSSARDVSERKAMENRLEHAAQHDVLTGLPNRGLFLKYLDASLKEREHNPSLRSAVLFIDLDRFKMTNDSLGHSVGDTLLKEFSQRLCNCVKTGDIVSRLAGDEFAVLLRDLKSHSDAKTIAERIHKSLETPFKLEGYEVFSSASIGMAFLNTTTTTPEDVLRNADVAMYSAKRAGGSSFTVFNSSMYQGYVERLSLEADLRNAVEQNQFSLVYQPILDLRSRELAGFEALLRWQHPSLGYITPDKFIPIAEETGIILQIDDWVLTESCRQMAVWQKKYAKARDAFMSVNLSVRHLMLDGVAGDLAKVIRNQGISPSCVKLEVTEGGVMTNAEAGAAVLARLRSEGIKIQIDDFGTGYSSLSYLHKLPLDSLKIDRSFVQRMEGGRQDIEIIRTILSLANSLNFDVVAEGIETQYQLETLASMGTTHGQGYFIAKPLPPHVAEARFFEEKRESVFV